MFVTGEVSAVRVDAAAERFAQLETLSPLLRDNIVRVLRVAAVELRKGRPLPLRLDEALDDLVTTIDTETIETATTSEDQHAPDWE